MEYNSSFFMYLGIVLPNWEYIKLSKEIKK